MSSGPDLPTAPPVESCHKWAYVTAGPGEGAYYDIMAIDQMGRLWFGQFRGDGLVYWWEANKPEVK